MSIIQGTAKSGGSASFYDFPIEQSLRFDGNSYLSKNFTSGAEKKKTVSFWIKRSEIGTEQHIIGSVNSTNSTSNVSLINIQTNNELRSYLEPNTSGTYSYVDSTAVYRDTSSFYHIVLVLDSTLTNANDIYKFYINGTLQSQTIHSAFVTDRIYSLFNANTTNNIGRSAYTSANYFNGYLANIQFIDGQALDQYFFGEFKDNIWVPYNAFSTAGSGTATASDGDTATNSYGTNGFHLDFADSSNIGNDVSGNNNDWTVN